jgi:hypothetical protein
MFASVFCDRDKPSIGLSSLRLSRIEKASNGDRGIPWLFLVFASGAHGWPGRLSLLALLFRPENSPGLLVQRAVVP